MMNIIFYYQINRFKVAEKKYINNINLFIYEKISNCLFK